MKLKMTDLNKSLSVETLKNMFARNIHSKTGLMKGVFLGAIAFVGVANAETEKNNFPYNNVETVEEGDQKLVKTTTPDKISLVGTIGEKEVFKANVEGNEFSIKHKITSGAKVDDIFKSGTIVYNGVEVENIKINPKVSYTNAIIKDTRGNIVKFTDGMSNGSFTATYDEKNRLTSRDWDNGRFLHLGYDQAGQVIFQENERGDNIISVMNEQVVDGISFNVRETKFYEESVLTSFEASIIDEKGESTLITNIGFYENGNTSWIKTFNQDDAEKYDLVSFYGNGTTISETGQYQENGNYVSKKYLQNGSLLALSEVKPNGVMVYDVNIEAGDNTSRVAIAEAGDKIYFYGDESNIHTTKIEKSGTHLVIAQEYSTFNPISGDEDIFSKVSTYNIEDPRVPSDVQISLVDLEKNEVRPLIQNMYEITDGGSANRLSATILFNKENPLSESNPDELHYDENGKISSLHIYRDNRANIQDYKDGKLTKNMLVEVLPNGDFGGVIQDEDIHPQKTAFINKDGIAKCIQPYIGLKDKNQDSCFHSIDLVWDNTNNQNNVEVNEKEMVQIFKILSKAPDEREQELFSIVVDNSDIGNKELLSIVEDANEAVTSDKKTILEKEASPKKAKFIQPSIG